MKMSSQRYSYDRRSKVAAVFYGLNGVGEVPGDPIQSAKDQEDLIREVIADFKKYTREFQRVVPMLENLGKGLESEKYLNIAKHIITHIKEIEWVSSKIEALIHPLKELEESVHKFLKENPEAGAGEVSKIPAYRKYLEAAKPIATIVHKWGSDHGTPDTYLEDDFGEDCKIWDKISSALPEEDPIGDGMVPDCVFGYLYHIAESDNLNKIRAKHGLH